MFSGNLTIYITFLRAKVQKIFQANKKKWGNLIFFLIFPNLNIHSIITNT